MKQLLANLLVLFALTASLPALAAEADAATTEDEQADAGTESPLDDETSVDAGAAQDDAVSDTAGDIAGTDEASDPPRDPNEPFVPSVQISEDLSVSFPVDI